MRKSILAAVAAALLVSPSAFAQNAHALRAAKLMQQLRQVPVADIPTDVPEMARPLLTQSKQELRDFIEALLNETDTLSSEDEFRAAAVKTLQDAGIPFHFAQPGTTIESDDPEYDKYGYLTELKVAEPDGHPELRSVITTLQIPCGSDSTFSVFEKAEQGWKRVLTEETDGYDKISGALGNFDYKISPAAADGSWFALTANINPWCSSDWQTIRYNVLRRTTDADHPETVFARTNAVFLGADDDYKLYVSADEFKVAYFGDEPLDTSKLIRVHTDDFKLLNNEAHRLAPIALGPHEFVDEWTSLPWTEAAAWITPGRADDLKKWHDRLARSDGRAYTSDFQFAQSCPPAGNGAERWQVGLSLEADRTAKDLPNQIIFTVGRQNDTFFVEDISERREGGCPGNNEPTDSWTGYNLP